MTVALALLLATAATALVAKSPTPAADLFDVTMGVCYGLVTGDVKLGRSIADDTKALEAKRVKFGLSSATLNRLGPSGTGLISQSIIGERSNGDSLIVLAVGGRMPGCRSMLVSKDVAAQIDETVKLLTTAGWKEAPATNAPGALFTRRMFVRRDTKGQPYLINMMTGTPPASDIRVITTVNPIPPGVQLPKGF